nr:hypothetical protein [Kribbella shirazensis]
MQDTGDLSDELKERIDTELEVYVSAATRWELSIKAASGRIDLPEELGDVVEDSGLSELPIRTAHAELAGGCRRSTAIRSTECWLRRRWSRS